MQICKNKFSSKFLISHISVIDESAEHRDDMPSLHKVSSEVFSPAKDAEVEDEETREEENEEGEEYQGEE